MNNKNIRQRVARLLNEITEATQGLPTGKANQIRNKASKLALCAKRHPIPTEEDMEARENVKQAIFDAMMGGRRLTLLDAREFRTADIRTPVSHLRREFEAAGVKVSKGWVVTAGGRHIREYWIERNN